MNFSFDSVRELANKRMHSRDLVPLCLMLLRLAGEKCLSCRYLKVVGKQPISVLSQTCNDLTVYSYTIRPRG